MSKLDNVKLNVGRHSPQIAVDYSRVLIPIQTKGETEPIYCICGMGGYPLRFFRMLRYMRWDQKVYFFRSRGFEDGENIHSTIEDIAADYLNEIKKIQPHGPYHFLGESSGGLVAFEMAQQLLQQGEKTLFLGLLDTFITSRMQKEKSEPLPFYLLIQKHFQTLAGGGVDGVFAYMKYYARLLSFNLFQFRTWLKKMKNWIKYGRLPDVFSRISQANRAASLAYSPKPYPGTVVLFRAMRQMPFDGNGTDNGWGEVGVANLVVHPLDCYHGNILFEPFAQLVAEKVNQGLSEFSDKQTTSS